MKKFRKVYVEITNICNMHCSFCPETKRAKATMSKQEFEYVAKQVCEYTDYVYLHVKGEPLIHPELREILAICDKYKLKVNISTNGTLLAKKVELLKDIRQINVSLHSFEKKDENELNNYLDDVLASCDELNKAGVIIRYKLWNEQAKGISKNNGEIIHRLEQKYNANILDSSYEKDVKLCDGVFLSIKTPFKWPSLKDENIVTTTCYGLRNQIAVLVDGTVVPCCVDNDGDINLGNIFDNNLKEILESKKAQEIKKNFENNKCIHELCKRCEYRIRVTQM